MTDLMQQIDQDTAWFIVSVLAGVLAMVLVILAAHLRWEREWKRKRQIIDTQWKVPTYPDLETPAYLRPEHGTARHQHGNLPTVNPVAAKPYDLASLVDPPEPPREPVRYYSLLKTPKA